jgi:hypothetical protein
VDAGVEPRNLGLLETADLRVSSFSGRKSRELTEIREKLDRILDHLPTKEKRALLPVLEEYLALFCNARTGVLTSTKGCHEIRTGDALPIKKNPYRVRYALKNELRCQLDEMLDKGVINPCASPWAAPVILVPNKSPDGTPTYRFCTDFPGLNSVTVTPV